MILCYRVSIAGSAQVLFASFAAALDYGRNLTLAGTVVHAIINDNRTDGGPRQGLTEDEYMQALEICS